MTFDEIINFTYDWISVFAGFSEKMMVPIQDIANEINLTLPEFIGKHTLFGIMFGAGFTIIVAITLVKWCIDVID